MFYYRCKVGASTNLRSSDSFSKATDVRKIEKCSQSALRNVVEIHLRDEKPLDSTKVDMVSVKVYYKFMIYSNISVFYPLYC